MIRTDVKVRVWVALPPPAPHPIKGTLMGPFCVWED